MKCLIRNNDIYLEIGEKIEFNGWKVTSTSVEGQNSGRSINGTAIRDVITSKRTIEVSLVPMAEDDLKEVLNAIDGTGFYVTYTDVQYGEVTKHFYADGYSWSFCNQQDGVNWYYSFSFRMVEF